jgi:hypothetical protein
MSRRFRMKLLYPAYVKFGKLAPWMRDIGWAHNLIIMTRCTDELEREFHIRMTRKFGGTKNVLIHQIDNQSGDRNSPRPDQLRRSRYRLHYLP